MDQTFQHYLLGLVAVANNIPAIGPFLALVGGLTTAQALRLTLVASFSSFVIMVISMVAGAGVLAFFGISISAFQIAGGVLLCGTGMSMLHSKTNSNIAGKEIATGPADSSTLISQAVVPIAMPLTAGAGTISTVTVFAESAAKTGSVLELFMAICVVSFIIFLVFHYAIPLIKILGETGMNVLLKVMGLFTLAIGIQFIVTGVSTIYRGLIA